MWITSFRHVDKFLIYVHCTYIKSYVYTWRKWFTYKQIIKSQNSLRIQQRIMHNSDTSDYVCMSYIRNQIYVCLFLHDCLSRLHFLAIKGSLSWTEIRQSKTLRLHSVVRQTVLVRWGMIEFGVLDFGGILCLFQLKML